MTDSNTKAYSCPRCTVGLCYPQVSTYVDVVQGQLLSVPDMPVYVCDICHFAEFDEDALESLWDNLDLDNLMNHTFPLLANKDHSTPLSD